MTDVRAWRSLVATKMLMAGSGAVFTVFLLAHMYGNLKAFQGQAAFNQYAEHLRTFGEPVLPRDGLLWILRGGLLLSLAMHVTCALLLWRRSVRARTTRYVVRSSAQATFSSRSMRWGGLVLLLFLIWHLLHFTIGKVNVRGGPTDDPYRLLVDSFQTWWLTTVYLLAMAALAMHLRHGVWSAAQTLGLTNSAAARRNANLLGVLLAVAIAGGFSLVPLFTMLGVIS